MRLLVATNNAHKLGEIRAILAGLPIPLLAPMDLGGLPDQPETGATFAENAAQKAVAAAKFAAGKGLADVCAVADDSGLEVAALGQAPGIYSARYAKTDPERIARVLRELGDNPDRRARFVCVIALAAADRLLASFRGEAVGTLLAAPRGKSGFGYDPIFVPDGYLQTFAELGSAIKDRISHRARALSALRDYLVTIG
jgi:XTP/dITP diphosphohydrolase